MVIGDALPVDSPKGHNKHLSCFTPTHPSPTCGCVPVYALKGSDCALLQMVSEHV